MTQDRHIYDDYRVTRERVADFANAPEEEQLRVLTFLRARNAFHVVEDIPTAIATSLAFIAIVLVVLRVPVIALDQAGPLVFPLAVLVGVLAFIVVGSLTIWAMKWGRTDKAKAALWLAAYETELTRRYAATGKDAKRWRKQHSIIWE